MDPRLDLLQHRVRRMDPFRPVGKVSQNLGVLVEATGPEASVGELCRIRTRQGWLPAEVVGFREDRLLLMALEETGGLTPGAPIVATGRPLMGPAGRALLGRVLDALGRPLDGRGPLRGVAWRPLEAEPPRALERPRITEPMATGIRAIDALVTLGKGQRVGLFAGTGVGKSVLLGCIARHTQARVNVLALVGERGREVREFLERDLAGAMERSVVVVATAEEPPLVRIKAALLAMTVAESLRDEGYDVLFMMDSLTRVATAQREIGLAAGEPPTTRGYPPSVFTLLPRLLERGGLSPRGSITAIFAILVESDDLAEPVADAARAILDGHIVLSRRLANAQHYPAVDVLESVSRVMNEVTTREHQEAAARLRRWLAAYRESEDAIQLGAYVRGSHPLVDEALERWPQINAFLRQGREEGSPWEETLSRLMALAGDGNSDSAGRGA
jgi:flagellum-specific ATP synthase